ncbi:hypothetical protein HI030_04330 [Staphylococcus haemolyticus]|nr:hypothetical protein HI030_04330 [Staphylococcus haemolyticus]
MQILEKKLNIVNQGLLNPDREDDDMTSLSYNEKLQQYAELLVKNRYECTT